MGRRALPACSEEWNSPTCLAVKVKACIILSSTESVIYVIAHIRMKEGEERKSKTRKTTTMDKEPHSEVHRNRRAKRATSLPVRSDDGGGRAAPPPGVVLVPMGRGQ